MAAPALLALALGTLAVMAAPPEGPHLSLSPPEPKPRQPFNVTCSFGVAVPAANVTVTANDDARPVTLSQDGHRATATVTVATEGSVRLGCTVLAGSRELRASATAQAYHVPVPLLDVADAAVAGTALRGSCSLPAGAVRDIRVRVLAAGRGVLRDSEQPPVTFELRAREEDAEPGLEVTCVAKMDPYNSRSKSQRIRVLVKPRLDPERCPPQQNWTEGQEGILHCSAGGAPAPQVSCSKDGNSLAPGAARPAARAHAGTYLCQATNELGTAERNVTVRVHYEDSFPLLPVLLGVLLPAAALLGLAALLVLRHRARIGEYRLWKRQPPQDARPLRAPGSSAAAAPNGSAAP
ncbi:intercellular adhesion molecule 5-like [Onychostruthus taczanowskii]|uniref:intercellular adhesion molecule 5-like n=1 Tax=Onychostruthus taczanowskii TaxID=356909 RepID=UPI001B7FF3FF|nr:intercellular adhesion molecule 5-like [Onychostruthus taczanowskii]